MILLLDNQDSFVYNLYQYLGELGAQPMVVRSNKITVPEIGTIQAKETPFAVLTSNNTRELSDALKRRCLHLFLDFPDPKTEMKIILTRVPEAGEGIAEEIVTFIERLRKIEQDLFAIHNAGAAVRGGAEDR